MKSKITPAEEIYSQYNKLGRFIKEMLTETERDSILYMIKQAQTQARDAALEVFKSKAKQNGWVMYLNHINDLQHSEELKV